VAVSNNLHNQVTGDGRTVYTPAEIRDAYGINNLSLDGAGQTIAIVDAYDNPSIFQALDTFDLQFGVTPLAQPCFNNMAGDRFLERHQSAR